MKFILIPLILIVVCYQAFGRNIFWSGKKCDKEEDIQYYELYCDRYFICKNKVYEEKKCKNGEVVNTITKKCVSHCDDEFNCPTLLTQQSMHC